MNNFLFKIASSIIHAKTKAEEFDAGKAYADFLNSLTVPETCYSDEETTLTGGVALSPLQAANCTLEHIRTVRFIKGTHLAILELLKRFPHEQLNILYAGTGPFATIILPVLSLLPKTSVSLTLLDISSQSIASVKSLFHHLDFNSFVAEILHADAITYTYSSSKKLHMVISETMFEALNREPQIAITANLAKQICKGGIFIPEQINIDLLYADFNSEPNLQISNESDLILSNTSFKERVVLAKSVLSLDLDNNFSDCGQEKIHYTPWFTTSSLSFSVPDLCLFTTVKVWDHVVIHSSQSTITNPVCISSFHTLNQFGSFRLYYSFQHIPQWSIEYRKD